MKKVIFLGMILFLYFSCKSINKEEMCYIINSSREESKKNIKESLQKQLKIKFSTYKSGDTWAAFKYKESYFLILFVLSDVNNNKDNDTFVIILNEKLYNSLFKEGNKKKSNKLIKNLALNLVNKKGYIVCE